MKILQLVFAIFMCNILPAQYYYKDVVANVETNLLNQKIKKAKVVSLVVKSYDFDNGEIDNFLCEQQIENNGKHTFTLTGSPYTGENHLHSFFTSASQIIRSVDSNPTIIIQNNYDYLMNVGLKNITITTFEPGSKDKVIEQHQWLYNDKSIVSKMYLIKAGNDTTFVNFTVDSLTKLPTEEIVTYKGRIKERYYYYYDEKNRLTDVVRFNPIKRKLLPEFIFEYNDLNQVTQKTIFTTGTNDYQNWFYKYNEYGLKSEEQCFLKGNMFRGKLVYNYKYE